MEFVKKNIWQIGMTVVALIVGYTTLKGQVSIVEANYLELNDMFISHEAENDDYVHDSNLINQEILIELRELQTKVDLLLEDKIKTD